MVPKLAILGLGSRTTAMLFEIMNRAYNQQHDASSTFPLILFNTDFATINPYLPNGSSQLMNNLSHYFATISKLGCTHLAAPNITLLPFLEKTASNLVVLNPLSLVVSECEALNINELMVFGTRHSVKSQYLKDYFATEGITLMAPTGDDIDFLDHYRQRLYSYSEQPKDIDKYQRILEKYSLHTTVLLACTEFSLVPHLSKSVLDPMYLLTEHVAQNYY